MSSPSDPLVAAVHPTSASSTAISDEALRLLRSARHRARTVEESLRSLAPADRNAAQLGLAQFELDTARLLLTLGR